MKRLSLALVILATFNGAARAQDAPSHWKDASECKEYLPKNAPCRVTIPVSDVSNGVSAAPTHVDVAIHPGATAVVVLTDTSTLMKRTVDKNWKYSYGDDAAFVTAAKLMHKDLKQMFLDPLPSGDDQKTVGQGVDANGKALDAFKKKYANKAGQLEPAECNSDNTCIQRFQAWFSDADGRVRKLKSEMKPLPAQVQSLQDVQAAMKPA